MFSQLSSQGILVPNGFAVTTRAYEYLLNENGLKEQLAEALAGLVPDKPDDLLARAQHCQDLLYNAGIPDRVGNEITQAFDQLVSEYGQALTVAVRSSATAEDLPTASFAGQHESFLNVDGGSIRQTNRV